VHEIPQPFSKVALDKVASFALLIVSLPVSMVIATSIIVESQLRSSSRGGVFHSEIRMSAGHPFTLYKFRILTPMGEAAIKAGTKPKSVENDRSNLTKVGTVLKKIGLDELPQLVNVLRGEISLVGPRPKPIPEYRSELEHGNIFRAQLRAGLSGPAQVLKGTVRTVQDSIDADFAYADLMRQGSQWQIIKFDLVTLLKTVRVLFRATGE
jgi:lipopolysaccharide/colanic/teichoic acid biosynthesis glycosyltransferase